MNSCIVYSLAIHAFCALWWSAEEPACVSDLVLRCQCAKLSSLPWQTLGLGVASLDGDVTTPTRISTAAKLRVTQWRTAHLNKRANLASQSPRFQATSIVQRNGSFCVVATREIARGEAIGPIRGDLYTPAEYDSAFGALAECVE